MKKNRWIFLGVALVLLSGCGGEKTEKHISSSHKEKGDVTDITKKTATELAQKARDTAVDAVEDVKKGAKETLAKTKDELSKVIVAQAPGDKGKKLYVKCAGCHGANGEKHALGKSAVLAGQSASVLANKLKAYRAGTRNIAGMGTVMRGQLASLNERDILALAEYISTFKLKGK